MREGTFYQNGWHLPVALGAAEKRSEMYMQYGERASQAATPRYGKILGGFWAPPRSRTRKCESL